MKRTERYQRGQGVAHGFVGGCRNTCKSIRDAVTRAKEAVLREYAHLVEEHGRVLRLALNEAEAIAWQTDFPHLIFPALATEKAQATVAWHQRQRAVRGTAGEWAFAE